MIRYKKRYLIIRHIFSRSARKCVLLTHTFAAARKEESENGGRHDATKSDNSETKPKQHGGLIGGNVFRILPSWYHVAMDTV